MNGNAYRIYQSETVSAIINSSLAATINGRFALEYDDGTKDTINLPNFVTGTGALPQVMPVSHVARRDGWVVDGYLSAPTAGKRGQTYARLILGRNVGVDNVIPRAIIGASYVYGTAFPRIGYFVESGPAGGEGVVRSIDLGDPAAGSDYTAQTVPVNRTWKLRGFNGTLVTDANAANRKVIMEVRDGSDVLVGGAANRPIQQASVTAEYHGFMVGQISDGTNTAITDEVDQFIGWSPTFDHIPEAFDVLIETTNIQVGDDWGDGQLLVEEWIEV